MNRLKPYFRVWTISAVSGCSANLFILFLSGRLKGITGFQVFEIDYFMHLFISSPFSNLNNLDTLVVLGSSLIYWGMGGFLFLESQSVLRLKNTLREDLSAMLQFLAVGFLIYYFLVMFCCWSLALYEGYVPMIFENIYVHHGPWRFVSHLRLIITGAFLPAFASLILSVTSFFLKFNRHSLALAFINCLTATVHLFSHLWLID